MYRAMKELSQAAQSAEFHLPAANTADAEFFPRRPDMTSFASEAECTATHRTTPSRWHRNFPTERLGTRVATARLRLSRPASLCAQAERGAACGRCSPVAPVFVDAAAPRTVIVKRGDSFWKLAQVNLGDGHRWHELLAVNPSIVDPQHLVPRDDHQHPGSGPAAPIVPSGAGGFDDHRPQRRQPVADRPDQAGLRRLLGLHREANPAIVDANRIYTGQTLNLPRSCESGRESNPQGSRAFQALGFLASFASTIAATYSSLSLM